MPGQRDISLAQVLFYSWEVIAMRELQFHIMWPFLRASRLISSHLLFPLIFKFPCTIGENIRVFHIEIIHLIGCNITTVIVIIFTESPLELFNQLIPEIRTYLDSGVQQFCILFRFRTKYDRSSSHSILRGKLLLPSRRKWMPAQSCVVRRHWLSPSFPVLMTSMMSWMYGTIMLSRWRKRIWLLSLKKGWSLCHRYPALADLAGLREKKHWSEGLWYTLRNSEDWYKERWNLKVIEVVALRKGEMNSCH